MSKSIQELHEWADRLEREYAPMFEEARKYRIRKIIEADREEYERQLSGKPATRPHIDVMDLVPELREVCTDLRVNGVTGTADEIREYSRKLPDMPRDLAAVCTGLSINGKPVFRGSS